MDPNVEIEFVAHWSDIDGNNHLNNVALFRMFQDTRSQIMQPLREIVAASHATLVVVHVELDFKRSAFLSDVLVSRAKIASIESKTFRIAYEVRVKEQVTRRRRRTTKRRGEKNLYHAGIYQIVANGLCVCAMQGSDGRAATLESIPGLMDGLNTAKQTRIRQTISRL